MNTTQSPKTETRGSHSSPTVLFRLVAFGKLLNGESGECHRYPPKNVSYTETQSEGRASKGDYREWLETYTDLSSQKRTLVNGVESISRTSEYATPQARSDIV